MIAIVTGCAQGIGKAIFSSLIEEGYFVIGIDKQKEALDQLELEIKAPHHFISADLAKEEDLQNIIEVILSYHQKIDLIVNNACFSNRGLLSGCSLKEFNEVLFTGVSAPYYFALKLQEHFNNGASIINISSTRARQSQKDTESYSAAKGAIEALTRSMAMSLQGKCRVNAIAPGWIDTINYEATSQDHLQQPSERIGGVEDIVKAVNYLKCKDNDFVNAEIINVDGGMHARMIYHGDEGWTYE